MRNRHAPFIGIVIASLLMLMAFQNCGRVGSEQVTIRSSASVPLDKGPSVQDLFHYPYQTAPEFYGQVQLAVSESEADFSDIEYIGIVGAQDGAEKTYAYTLDVTNENDYPVCPQKTGSLVGGSTTITGGCLSQVVSESVTLTLTVTVDGETLVFSRTY